MQNSTQASYYIRVILTRIYLMFVGDKSLETFETIPYFIGPPLIQSNEYQSCANIHRKKVYVCKVPPGEGFSSRTCIACKQAFF